VLANGTPVVAVPELWVRTGHIVAASATAVLCALTKINSDSERRLFTFFQSQDSDGLGLWGLTSPGEALLAVAAARTGCEEHIEVSWIEDEAMCSLVAQFADCDPDAWLKRWGPELLERLLVRGFVNVRESQLRVVDPVRFPSIAEEVAKAAAATSPSKEDVAMLLAGGSWEDLAQWCVSGAREGAASERLMVAMLQAISNFAPAAQRSLAAIVPSDDDEPCVAAERCRTWIAAALFDEHRAQAMCRSLFNRLRRHNDSQAIEVLGDLARFGAVTEAADFAHRLQPESLVGNLTVRLVRGFTSRSTQRMIEIADELEATDAHFYASELRLAATLRAIRTGETLPGFTEFHGVDSLGTPLAREVRRKNRSMLTRREHQVADLAANGLTSSAIGLVLDVSPRTVDNLLGRAYIKLGVPGRSALRKPTGHNDERLEGKIG
jgi:DNA-binding CsgD family transcriptional regulator